jgi:glycosyltransferase involved in cell wall biosynthesis
LNIGGPALHIALLATRMDPNRFSTCLVVGETDPGEGEILPDLRGESARIVRIKGLRRAIRPWADLFALIRLVRILRKERPEILHTHMAKAGTLGRVAGMIHNRMGGRSNGRGRSVLVHTFHGHVLEGYFSGWLSRFFLWIERWLARRTDCLIAVSPAIRDDLLEKKIGRPDQWKVIPLGLDLSALGRLPLPNGASPIRCGLVGRLVPIKNPSLFLEGICRFLERSKAGAIQAMVIGDGPLRQGLEKEASLKGIERVVQFTGWQRDPVSYYEGLDVVCLTSTSEGTPVCLIEAMAAGRAVVATDVGGVPDLLEESREGGMEIPLGGFRLALRGILVRPGDAEGLGAALAALAQDPNLRRSLGQAGRSYALRQFDASRLLQDISSLYERVANEL